jgi:hypothetical protein
MESTASVFRVKEKTEEVTFRENMKSHDVSTGLAWLTKDLTKELQLDKLPCSTEWKPG